MDKEQKIKLAARYYRYFDAFLKIGLATLPRKRVPLLKFLEGKDTYCDSEHGIIVIGLESEMYSYAKDEKDFIWITQYLLGHEMQHVLSTTGKAWTWGINAGTKLVCEEISRQVEGRTRRFVKDSDYDVFCKDLREKGVFISIPQIQEITHFIQNSLCDGRIERLRSIKRTGFRKVMIAGRGLLWKNNEMTQPKAYDALNAKEKLIIKLNQILSLSTTSLYEKGFLEAYDETPLRNEIDELLPIIAKGVKSSNCLACMKQAVKIERILVPEIIRVCTMDMDAMQQILDKLPKTCDDNSYSGMSNEEETGKEDEPGEGENTSNDSASSGMENKLNSSSTNNSSDAKDTSWGLSISSSESHRNVGASAQELTAETINNIDKMIDQLASEAAEAARNEAASICGSVPANRKEKETPDSQIPVTANGIAEKYSDTISFKEARRKYDLAYPLPFDLAGRAEKFAHDIEKLLHNQQEPYVRGRMSGALDSGKISKLLMKQGDFYRKKGKVPEFNGCGYILLDNSGSMGHGRGSKREYACEALAVIEEGFKRYMPVKITAYDSYGTNHVSHEVIKGFDEKMNNSCSYNFFLSGRTGGGNKDGFSIRIAAKELLERPEKEKLLVVASDGTPSSYTDYIGGMADVRDAVADARNKGIKVIGIFFADDYSNAKEAEEFRSMYQFDCVCTVPEMIESELTKVMTRFMFG